MFVLFLCVPATFLSCNFEVFFHNIELYNSLSGGTRWRSWLKYCVTSREVAGSIPDGVIGILH